MIVAERTARLFEELFAESDGDELDRLQYVDTKLYLPADILVKVDRMSMQHSLEARVPFLDRSMLDLWWDEFGLGDIQLWRHWEHSWPDQKGSD